MTPAPRQVAVLAALSGQTAIFEQSMQPFSRASVTITPCDKVPRERLWSTAVCDNICLCQGDVADVAFRFGLRRYCDQYKPAASAVQQLELDP